MLTINGHKFAKNEKEFVDTLFHKDGTAYGYYKLLKGKIHFMDMPGTLFAALVYNPGKFAAFTMPRIAYKRLGNLWTLRIGAMTFGNIFA